MTVTKIVVEEDKITVFKKEEICLATFKPSEQMHPALMERGYTLVLPTFSGYGFAYHPETGWAKVDLDGNSFETNSEKQMPDKGIFRSLAIPQGEWSQKCNRIPVYIKFPLYRIGGK